MEQQDKLDQLVAENQELFALTKQAFVKHEVEKESVPVDEEYIRMVDRPSPHYNVKRVIEDLCRFNGHVIIQTLFMNGTLTLQWSGHNEVETYDVDNTSEAYVGPWLEALGRIRPSGVMVYTIDRETPVGGLLKAPREELDRIAERVRAMGMHCTVSY